jgi:hypothetical protein
MSFATNLGIRVVKQYEVSNGSRYEAEAEAIKKQMFINLHLAVCKAMKEDPRDEIEATFMTNTILENIKELFPVIYDCHTAYKSAEQEEVV